MFSAETVFLKSPGHENPELVSRVSPTRVFNCSPSAFLLQPRFASTLRLTTAEKCDARLVKVNSGVWQRSPWGTKTPLYTRARKMRGTGRDLQRGEMNRNFFRERQPDIPVPPDQDLPSPIKEPPDTPQPEPPGPVREPEP